MTTAAFHFVHRRGCLQRHMQTRVRVQADEKCAMPARARTDAPMNCSRRSDPDRAVVQGVRDAAPFLQPLCRSFVDFAVEASARAWWSVVLLERLNFRFPQLSKKQNECLFWTRPSRSSRDERHERGSLRAGGRGGPEQKLACRRHPAAPHRVCTVPAKDPPAVMLQSDATLAMCSSSCLGAEAALQSSTRSTGARVPALAACRAQTCAHARALAHGPRGLIWPGDCRA